MHVHRLVSVVVVVVAVVAGVQDYDIPYCDGRQTIVHLFEWKWTDIAAECERFLGPNDFCAVQVSPPNEHVVVGENGFPWWQRYQPVSYKLESRSGSRQEFIDMTHRCNAVGVRIIVDAVVNHMAALGRSGTGSGGSSFNADDLDFPGVPYSNMDFTPRDLCPSANGMVNDYSNVDEVRNCYLVGLTDLYGGKDYVREKVSGYFNDLIDIGVMGFRVDAAKHMWPGDLEVIQSMTIDLNTEDGFPANARPFFFYEVIDEGGEPITVNDYFGVGRTTEFRYCKKIAWGINDFDLLGDVYDPGSGMAPSRKAVVFVDNHDNQRGHGSAGDVLTHKTPKEYTMAVSFTLAHSYGFARIMSSYYFDNTDQGPPGSGGSTDSVTINADGSCGGGWVCEHRWNAITKMVRFRNAVAGTLMSHWYQEGDNVAFSRGNKGFFAMSKLGSFDKTLQTGMPAGTYCELISGCANMVTVNGDGTAHITINNGEEPIFAICVGCDGTGPTTEPGHTTTQGTTTPSFTTSSRSTDHTTSQRTTTPYFTTSSPSTDHTTTQRTTTPYFTTSSPFFHTTTQRTTTPYFTTSSPFFHTTTQRTTTPYFTTSSPFFHTTTRRTTTPYFTTSSPFFHTTSRRTTTPYFTTSSPFFHTTSQRTTTPYFTTSSPFFHTTTRRTTTPYFTTSSPLRDRTTSQRTTTPPVTAQARTVIFVHKETSYGQDLFIRGGIDSTYRPGCTHSAETDACAIDITTNSLGADVHYEPYDAWRKGDTKLDWYGPQVGQGSYRGQAASGTPLAWTTNQPGGEGYQELNTYGEHYWMVDVVMDCDETENGWFEVKSFLTNGDGWESDVNQVSTCSGDAGGTKPYSSNNHMGRCGFINVFDFSASSCTIKSFP